MAYEVTTVLRFEGYPPERTDVEDAFDCIVIEWEEEEV